MTSVDWQRRQRPIQLKRNSSVRSLELFPLKKSGWILLSPGFSSRGWQNCTSCLNPITGRYIGSGGQTLTLAALQHGRVSPDLLNPVFGGMGDPGSTDIARQIQLSLRVRF